MMRLLRIVKSLLFFKSDKPAADSYAATSWPKPTNKKTFMKLEDPCDQSAVTFSDPAMGVADAKDSPTEMTSTVAIDPAPNSDARLSLR